MSLKRTLLLLMVGCLYQQALPAQEFGRLFTTPGQRQQLDELRKTQTEVKVEILDEELTLEQSTVVEEENNEQLRLKGLVYRSDGKNTAWINESNSYEGDLSSQYTNIIENGVSRSEVRIGVPGETEDNLSLRVGQSYDPVDGSVRDLMPKTQPTHNQADR